MAQTVYELSTADVDCTRVAGRIIHDCKPPEAGYTARGGYSA